MSKKKGKSTVTLDSDQAAAMSSAFEKALDRRLQQIPVEDIVDRAVHDSVTRWLMTKFGKTNAA